MTEQLKSLAKTQNCQSFAISLRLPCTAFYFLLPRWVCWSPRYVCYFSHVRQALGNVTKKDLGPHLKNTRPGRNEFLGWRERERGTIRRRETRKNTRDRDRERESGIPPFSPGIS